MKASSEHKRDKRAVVLAITAVLGDFTPNAWSAAVSEKTKDLEVLALLHDGRMNMIDILVDRIPIAPRDSDVHVHRHM